MTEREYQRYWRRTRRYGYTPEEAYSIPSQIPRWMHKVEREEGVSFVEFLRREIACRVSYAQIARSIGVHKDTLFHHIRKLKREGMLQ